MRIRHTLIALALLVIALRFAVPSAVAQAIRVRVLVSATTAPLASTIVRALAADGTVWGG